MTSILQDASSASSNTISRNNVHSPRPHSLPRPYTQNLLAWDNLPSSPGGGGGSSPSSPFGFGSPSSSSSPVLSPTTTMSTSQAFYYYYADNDIYSPHLKSQWQLAQSEPAISLEHGDDDEEGGEEEGEKEGGRGVAFVEVSPRKERMAMRAMRERERGDNNVKRRKTLHVDIPTKYIGHTRSIGDEDPVLALVVDEQDVYGDEAATADEIERFSMLARGRPTVRRDGNELRLVGRSLPPSDARTVLRFPPHIVCQATTDTTCPHGASCPYTHTHTQTQPPPSLKKKERHPSRTREILALADEVNALSRVLTRLTATAATATATATSSGTTTTRTVPSSPSGMPDVEEGINAGENGDTTGIVPSSELALVSEAEPSPISEPGSEPAPTSQVPGSEQGLGSPTPQTLQKGTSSTSTPPPLDALGLPSHPLMRTMDLTQYPYAKGFSSSGAAAAGAGGRRSRAGSVNSEESKRSVVGGGRHSRRHSGSSSGARFMVVDIPPFKARRRGSDASAPLRGVCGLASVKGGSRSHTPKDTGPPQAAREPPVHQQPGQEEEEGRPPTMPRPHMEMLDGSQLPSRTILKRPAVVLDDLTMGPSRTSQETQIQQQRPTVLKRPSVVLDDFQQPQQPTVVKRPSVVIDDLQQPYPTILKRPSTLLDDLLNTPPVPAQPTPTPTTTTTTSSPPTSNIPPPALIYDSSGARIVGGHPTGEKIRLHSPPLSLDELRNPPRTTRYGKLVRPGIGLFNNAVAGLSAEKRRESSTAAGTDGAAAAPETAKDGGKSTSKMSSSGGMFTKNQGMFSKGMFVLPMSVPLVPTPTTMEEKESRRTSQSSRSSNHNTPLISSPTNDPVSPSQTSHTVDSNSSDRTTHSNSLSKMFTSPIRPLFSGYEHVVPTDADGLPLDENLRRGAEEWLQRQREKDLRQALRLEKAFDEKRAGLVKRLEWKAPLVETGKGYGYGDDLEVQKETKLPTGEVFKVLTWDERLEMEQEVKKVEENLVKVREDIVKHGGIPGQAISYVGTALAEARARARAIDEKNTREREEKAAREREAMVASGKSESPITLDAIGSSPAIVHEDEANMPNPQEEAPTPDLQGEDHQTRPQFVLPTPETPGRFIKAEQEKIGKIPAGSERQRETEVDFPTTTTTTFAANDPPGNLARLAQKAPPVVNLPAHLMMPPSYRYGLTHSTSPTVKEDKPPTVVKRTAVVLDDGGWPIDPPVTENAPRPAPSGNGLLDLFTGAAILGGKPAKLTRQSMKRHEEMMAEDENRRIKDELVKTLLKNDPPKAPEATTSPPPRQPAPVKRASQESRPSMQARWGDSPLPGTAGAPDGPGSPPFQFMPPRPASSVPSPEAIARPSSVAPSAAQLMGPARHERRISMSTAKPGEETSTQTMEALNLDDSDDDNDETGEYLSAEEGEDSHSAGGEAEQSRPQESQTPEIDDSSRPTLQRKRSSTTSGLRVVAPVPENKHRPSPLDDWHFDFRKAQRDVVSPGPFSSAASTSGASIFGGRATPTRHQHHFGPHGRRRSSQEYNQFTPLFGYGVAAPNNTPDSPPPRRYEPVSPTRDRPSNAERYTVARMQSPQETTSQYSDDWEQRDGTEPTEEQVRAMHERPYFVVTRSANVLDEEANLIEYSTARVMSGGVKIGSIQPRGVDGVIQEEDEDAAELEVDFETTPPVVPLPLPGVPSTASPPLLGHQMTIPTYPLGVPVPGHPQAISSTPLVQMSMATGPQHQVAVAPNAHPATQLPTTSAAHLQKRPSSLALGSHGNHHAPHLSLPSPVTSTTGSQSHVAPVEYCGDFRTTGHCRFGTRCRYSHDIEPRVRTSSSAAASRYRPSTTSSVPEPAVSPRMTAAGIPHVPPGYQLSNVLPQPHHIPGVPLSQQPASPFVFAPSTSVAHPRTSPAATAAANRGVKMSNTEKANRILKSMGITPQQLLAHQPAPTVMADGEIMYDLTQGRSKEGVFIGQDHTLQLPTGLKLDRGMKEAHDMVLMRFGTEQEKRAVMGSSAGMVMDGEDEDIWTVTKGRKSQLPNEPGGSKEGQRRRSTRPREHDQTVPSHQYSHPQQYQQMEQDTRQSSRNYYQSDNDPRQLAQKRVPVSYSPVQQLGYPNPKQYQAPSHPTHGAMAQYQYPIPMTASVASVTPVTTPSPVPTAPAVGGSLTQEEVIKVLTALGLSVPGFTITPTHPTPPAAPQALYSSAQAVPSPGSQPAQNLQRPRYPPGPYDYTHPPMHH